MICSLLLAIALFLYTMAASDERADFTYVNPSGIHTLDPARMSWTQDLRIALNIWEGLTTYHPRTIEPMAGAAFFPPEISADGLTYTFTIRPDARWSNGENVTATDFVRGWRRGLEPGTATDYTFLFTDHIAGAAEYVRWRRSTVAVLASLRRLSEGWGVDAEGAEALLADDFCRRALLAGGIEIDPLLKSSPAAAERINRSRLDWPRLFEQRFRQHAGEFDDRFAQVGVQARAPDTLVVTLERPCAYFLDLTAFPTFSPCHESIELLRERYDGHPTTAEGLVVYDPQWTKPEYHRNGYPGLITNGPYRLAEWRFKRRTRLAVNPFFRDEADIPCRTIDMVVYDDINAAIMAYESGDLDFLPAMDVPYDHEIARLARTGERPDFKSCVLLATYFLNFNCLSREVNGRPNPFLDARVRQAFTLAIDKRAIVDQVLKRGDVVANSFIPPNAIAGYQPPTGPEYDVIAARRLLAEAGHPDGRGLPVIDLLYTPADQLVCQAMARMWEVNLNARVSLQGKETRTFGEDKANHRFMIARANWYADYNDPTTFLDCLATGNGNNDSGYSSESYDRLLEAASLETDAGRRAELLRRAEAIIIQEDFPILPILHYNAPIAIQPYVSGLYPNPRLVFPFRYVSVQR